MGSTPVLPPSGEIFLHTPSASRYPFRSGTNCCPAVFKQLVIGPFWVDFDLSDRPSVYKTGSRILLEKITGAGDRNRTRNLLLTKQLSATRKASVNYEVREVCLTAKLTAKPTDVCGRGRTIMDCRGQRSNLGGRLWTSTDGSPAVFKTVWGASTDVHPSSPTSASVHARTG